VKKPGDRHIDTVAQFPVEASQLFSAIMAVSGLLGTYYLVLTTIY